MVAQAGKDRADSGHLGRSTVFVWVPGVFPIHGVRWDWVRSRVAVAKAVTAVVALVGRR